MLYQIEVGINEKISEVITKLCILEDKIEDKTKKWNFTNQHRLVSSNGKIKELNPYKTFREEQIKMNETILLIPPGNLNFSEITKGHLIWLENRNRTAVKQGGDEPQMVMTEQGYSCGKNYFEFLLETEAIERSVIIGLSLKRTEYTNINVNEIKNFFGYILSECKKVSTNASGKVELVEYGDITKIGDRIGIMTEFTPTGVDVSFWINKVNMGVAFKNLPTATYYPALILGYDGTRVRVTNKVGFPDV
jgi:hypothetical protein